MEDFVSQTEGFLTVRKGQLVEVLDQGGGGGNWLVVALASAPGDLEDEGFLPARCLQPASKMGVSRPSPTDTASSRYGDKTTPHSSHDQLKYPSDRGSHDTRSSAITSSSKRSGRSQQLISQLVEDVYYSCEDTPQSTANEGLLSLAYGQSVEVLDASGGDLWLVKTTDTASGKTSEGLVQRFWLTPKPPPPRENVTLVQNGTEPHPPHQNGDTGMSELQPGRDTDRVQLRGHPLPTSSAPAAVLPGTLFGVYEPPKSMIFGKPEVNEGDIPVIEDSIKISTPTTKQAPPMILEQAPTPHKSEEEAKTATAADDELQRLQVASVNSQVQLDNFDPVEMYVAIADFDAAEDSNISLRAGEHVQLMDSSRSDWWLVSLPESGLSGWVPADYLEKKTLELEGRVASPRPEPFHDETGEIERVLKRC
ncbi:SH3 and PX domain-containing protein 2A, partial [Geodia barretti]